MVCSRRTDGPLTSPLMGPFERRGRESILCLVAMRSSEGTDLSLAIVSTFNNAYLGLPGQPRQILWCRERRRRRALTLAVSALLRGGRLAMSR